MQQHISRKQAPAATHNFHFHLDGEPPSAVVVLVFFSITGERKEESRDMPHVGGGGGGGDKLRVRSPRVGRGGRPNKN